MRFAQRPVRAFLRQRLGMNVREFSDEVEGDLPVELDGLGRWGVGQRLLDARLVDCTEDHRDALGELVDRVEARLRFTRLVADRLPADLAGHVAQGLEIVAAAGGAIDAGTLGYAAVYGARRTMAEEGSTGDAPTEHVA